MISREHPHRRYNALTGEWILVSPHRTKRPWLGKVEAAASESRPRHDPRCYLCPRNERMGGEANPDYQLPFVFQNDFSALLPEKNDAPTEVDPLFQWEPVSGECRVICFSPRHDMTIAEMSVEEIQAVVNTWCTQVEELGKSYRWVQVFENKGDVMGCSNPHPHGQIWAGDQIPNEPAKELQTQREYWEKNGRSLLSDYLKKEIDAQERIVIENEDWVVAVPFWAVWPYETLLLPRRAVKRLPELTKGERRSLSEILKRFLTRYDNLFQTSFPYSMGWHGAPHEPGDFSCWQLHAHFYPPLLRSATVKKFMVGYEMLGEPQRDLTPEQAAARLREISETHYRSG